MNQFMQISTAQEIVESSQQSAGSSTRRRGRPRTRGTVQRILPPRNKRSRIQSQRKSVVVNESQWQTETIFTIPESGTPEQEEVHNLSTSLFDGQGDLLQQYQDHESVQRPQENTLDRELERSRQAYERMRVDSASVFSGEVLSCEDGPVNLVKVPTEVPLQVHRSQSLQEDVAIQCTLQEWAAFEGLSRMLPHVPEYRDAAVQSSPETCPIATNTEHRNLEDIAVQTTIDPQPVVEFHSVAVNTDPVAPPVSRREVAVQMYHTTRVRHVALQTEQDGSPANLSRNKSHRNVSIQHSSASLLDLSMTNMVNLGTRLGLDPHLLRRAIIKSMSEQYGGSSVDSSGRQEMFYQGDQDEPYNANFEYFLEEIDDAEADSTRSELDEYVVGNSRFDESSE